MVLTKFIILVIQTENKQRFVISSSSGPFALFARNFHPKPEFIVAPTM